MTARVPWPEELRSRPFTVAEATAYGIGRRRANGASIIRPHPRLRSLRAVTSPVEVFQALARTLPEDVAFSHLSALRLWGLPWSVPWDAAEPVHIMHAASRRIRRQGIVAHPGLQRRATLTRYGVQLTAAADTWADLANLPTATVPLLVIVGDAILWRRRCGQSTLRDIVTARAGMPGVTLLREAADRLRSGSASPAETLTRLDFEAAGLPEPELNAQVGDLSGQWLATADFVWRRPRVVAEYDGAHHGDPRQFQRDAARRRLIEEAGWAYVQITALTRADRREYDAVLRQLRQWLT
ncbi:MAG: hypothetical protein IPI32_05160 [Austwickia sp.]|nr:hypothetical protein [Austwickia sp.]MBK8437020.1 hypothetical protein [Austwickia sp.]MBK9100646.1 hypothetical protein [Austwickia sp.]